MSPANGSVLIVDDDAAVRDSLRFALEAEGLRVHLYDGPKDLLAEPDMPERGCLVVDYNMPAMNGIEMVDILRRRHVDLPVVMIASRVSGDLRTRAARAGIASVLEKPLSDGALVDTLRLALMAGPEGESR